MMPSNKRGYELAKLAISGLSARDRQTLIRELSGKPEEIPPDRILRRAQVAARFNVSLRAVDVWGKSGILPKVKLPNRVRGCGYRESDVCALIEAKS